MNTGFFHARKSRAWQTINNYEWTGGPQHTSIAVSRRKTCVETRARTLGRELPNDMRVSMAELHGLSTEIFTPPKATARRSRKTRNKTPVAAIFASHSFKRFIQLKVSWHRALDTQAITSNYPWH
jgi:hypothetical protein